MGQNARLCGLPETPRLGDNSTMPKPTVQNTPKPEVAAPAKKRAAPAKTPPAVKKPFVVHRDPETRLTPTQTWYGKPGAIEELCDYVLGGGHLAGFCKERGYNYTSAARWIDASPERTGLYARAREERAELLADEIVSISDETEVLHIIDEETGAVEIKLDATAVARNRLRVDARKWVAAKLKPRKYGDKVTQEHVGANGGPIQTANVDLRGLSEAELKTMEALMAKAAGAAQ